MDAVDVGVGVASLVALAVVGGAAWGGRRRVEVSWIDHHLGQCTAIVVQGGEAGQPLGTVVYDDGFKSDAARAAREYVEAHAGAVVHVRGAKGWGISVWSDEQGAAHHRPL